MNNKNSVFFVLIASLFGWKILKLVISDTVSFISSDTICIRMKLNKVLGWLSGFLSII